MDGQASGLWCVSGWHWCGNTGVISCVGDNGKGEEPQRRAKAIINVQERMAEVDMVVQ